ncbi:hypothetical protein [Algibacter mikhailovii]|uniref:Uncharacterized protein n=1 Tax=Algibacter mikhailovii TaxID=425498 RepID=A0A918VGG7_9FLAO|nr:hypothetical protein [Algibacter mikhailovii]GGZ95088.1 hypothetical protein GCM10007028_36480 [Algibacter mikhailovii]
MATWIWNTSIEKNIDELNIDIIKKEVNLNEFEIEPILIFLPRLNAAISKTLENENYPSDYIQEAKFFIKIFKNHPHVKCTAFLSDIEGKKYMGDSISFNVNDNNFKEFKVRPSNDMDWASEGENQLNTSEWFGALIRYFMGFGKTKFNSFYNQKELKKNAIIGNLFQITLLIVFFYLLYRFTQ